MPFSVSGPISTIETSSGDCGFAGGTLEASQIGERPDGFWAATEKMIMASNKIVQKLRFIKGTSSIKFP